MCSNIPGLVRCIQQVNKMVLTLWPQQKPRAAYFVLDPLFVLISLTRDCRLPTAGPGLATPCMKPPKAPCFSGVSGGNQDADA